MSSGGHGPGGQGDGNRRKAPEGPRRTQMGGRAAPFAPFSASAQRSTSSAQPSSSSVQPSSSWDEAFAQPSSSRTVTQPSSSQRPKRDREATPPIETLEDQVLKETKGRFFDGLQGRSSYGTAGQKIMLNTNYFEMTEGRGPTIYYKYNVSFDRDDLTRSKKRQAITQVLCEPMFQGFHTATDYGTIIVTMKQLPFHDQGTWKQKIIIEPPPSTGEPLRPAGQGESAHLAEARARNTTTVTLQRALSFSVEHLFHSLQTQLSLTQCPAEEMTQLLNIILNKVPNTDRSVVNGGQNRFFPIRQPGLELDDGLRAMRGFFSSVRLTIGRLLLNVNAISGVFYKPLPLLELRGVVGGDDGYFEALISRLKVEVRYCKDGEKKPYMTRQKTIFGFARNPRFGDSNATTFQLDNVHPPRTVSVAQYFKETYQITLGFPNLPVLNVGVAQKPIYIPQELCSLLPGQQYRRLLSGEKTSRMITFAARSPTQNQASIINDGLNMFSITDNTGQVAPQERTIKPWGFTVGTHMVTVPGRVLKPPEIIYDREKKAQVSSGGWNLKHQRFVMPGRFQCSAVAQIDQIDRDGQHNPALRDANVIDDLHRCLQSYGIGLGQRLSRINVIAMSAPVDLHRDQNERMLDALFNEASNRGVGILLIILPAIERWLYARIKYHGDVKYGIHTVCAVGDKLSNRQNKDMYMANLALKYNLKGGGIAHCINNLLASPLGPMTMVVGIDVTHPSPGSAAKAPSIACVVASTDKNLFQWPGSIRCQTEKKEMVDGLTEMIIERLRLFEKKNETLPDQVLIYRDGVSEGQFRTVMNDEFPQFTAAYNRVYGGKSNHPKSTLVIVGKRHHTRFYPRNRDGGDNTGNPHPGTIVDRGLAGHTVHEFWLQSHKAIKGVARPAHYTVLRDEIGFTGDQLQVFTHRMCHMFVRCTRSVSICPPAYYADRLAERGRQYLHSVLREHNTGEYDAAREWNGQIHENIRESTWYM